MSALLPSGGAAVMASRREPPDSLDFFPTPPWATRALLTHVLASRALMDEQTAWDPACGEGHMVIPLAEAFHVAVGTDVFDYGRGFEALDFLGVRDRGADWIITNPPFKVAEEFAAHALDHAGVGVAFLVRSVWLEGTGRYARLFKPRPPSIVAQFCERVPMTRGRWDPDASTATSYAWVVWMKESPAPHTLFEHIPPGCRAGLTRPTDAERLGVRKISPLFDGAAA